jgi:hypothetical protein
VRPVARYTGAKAVVYSAGVNDTDHVPASGKQLAANSPSEPQYSHVMALPHVPPSTGRETGHTGPLGGTLCNAHLHWSDAAHAVGPTRCTDGAQYAHIPPYVQPWGWLHD